ncbi:MAG TPA: cytochrome P450 [Pseudonocardia sp.]|jgi:cytochrome P450
MASPTISTVTEKAAHFDHLDTEFAADPGPVWKAMRSECPMAKSELYDGFWVPTRYDDINEIAHDHERFSSSRVAIPADLFGQELNLPPITSDPPYHTKFRRMLLPTFSPKNMAAWEPATYDIANELIDAFSDRDEFDGAREYAQNIPITVIARMLGVDENDRDIFTSWLRRLLELGPANPEDAQQAFIELSEYLMNNIQQHRAEPTGDIMSILIDTELDGERLTDGDLLGACQLLLIAGIDTTWSSIGSTIHHLAKHPEHRRILVDALDEPDGKVWYTAMEEFLRVFAPVTMARRVTQDTEMRGQCLRAGDQLLLPFPAANRDPEKFENPDEVIIDRQDNRHYSFGVGRHRCLGSHLARMEAEVALRALLRRVPDFSVPEGKVVRYSGGQIRGPREMPLIKRSS